MKVLFIAGADQQYGTFQMSKLLLENVKKENSNIKFIVITQKYGPLNEWCKGEDIENYIFPYRYCVYHPSGKYIKDKAKLIAKQVLVTIFNRIALWKLGRANIMSDVNIIHTNNNRDLFGMLISRKYDLPNVTYLREFSKAHFNLQPLYRKQVDIMNRYSINFIAISDAVKKDWIEYGISGNKVKVIYDGVDVIKYTDQKRVRNSFEPLRIVMAGAIYEGKGQKELVEAVAPLIAAGLDIYIDFYGKAASEKYYQEIVEFIKGHKLEMAIRFMGYKEDFKNVLGNYDIGVVCSKAEGFGLVTVEYMLTGLTVIASDTGANPEILEFGKYGYLYPYGEVEELRKLINTVYQNGDRSNQFTQSMIDFSKSKYSINTTVKEVSTLYTSIVQCAGK